MYMVFRIGNLIISMIVLLAAAYGFQNIQTGLLFAIFAYIIFEGFIQAAAHEDLKRYFTAYYSSFFNHNHPPQ